jgi:hypothetical protein
MRGLSADSMDECAAPEELCATAHEHTTRKRQRAKHSTPAETQRTAPYLLCGGISQEARKQNSPTLFGSQCAPVEPSARATRALFAAALVVDVSDSVSV